MNRIGQQNFDIPIPATMPEAYPDGQNKIALERVEALKNILMDKNPGKVHKLYEKFADFALGLQAKYPDCKEYIFWHSIIGSTPPDTCTKFDFPGEDSILKFLEKLNSEEHN